MVNNSEKKQLMEAIIHYFHRHFPKHRKVEIIKQISAKLTKLKPSKKKNPKTNWCSSILFKPIVWCPLGKLRCPWGNCTDSGRFIPPYQALFHSDLGEPWHTLAVSVATDC